MGQPTTAAAVATDRHGMASKPGGGVVGRLYEVRGATCVFARHQTLAVDRAPVERVYRIDAGLVRCCRYTRDGLRQIVAFAGPGELLGFPDPDIWRFTAEAVGPVAARYVRADTLEAELRRDALLLAALRRVCVTQFEARERHLVWVSHLPAEERLLAFLDAFEQVAARRDGWAELPMTRLDIGDHLGMTLETVSRGFGALKRRGLIAMDGANRYRLRGRPADRTAA